MGTNAGLNLSGKSILGRELGSELVTNGGFAVVTDDASELSSGSLTIGNCYKISAHTEQDFTADGSPDNNVGTYFNATGTNVTLDADDKVFPVTCDNWGEDAGWASQATAGVLTGKMQKVAGTGSNLSQGGVVTSGLLCRVSIVITRSAGSAWTGGALGGSGVISTSGTYTYYTTSTGTAFIFTGNSSFVGTIDSVSIKEVL